MAKQTRVEKYKKLRSDIEKMDTYSLEQVEKDNLNRKQRIVKESIRHACKDESKSLNSPTITMSIDQLLEGHSEYVGEREEQMRIKKHQKRKKMRLIGLVSLSILLIVVFAIVIITYLNV